jgi:hypothetical protein
MTALQTSATASTLHAYPQQQFLHLQRSLQRCMRRRQQLFKLQRHLMVTAPHTQTAAATFIVSISCRTSLQHNISIAARAVPTPFFKSTAETA